MSLDPAVKARLEREVSRGVEGIDLNGDIRAVLSEVERLEQESALLRAECVKNRALRRAYPTDAGYLDVLDAYYAARAATDAAGLLK